MKTAAEEAAEAEAAYLRAEAKGLIKFCRPMAPPLRNPPPPAPAAAAVHAGETPEEKAFAWAMARGLVRLYAPGAPSAEQSHLPSSQLPEAALNDPAHWPEPALVDYSIPKPSGPGRRQFVQSVREFMRRRNKSSGSILAASTVEAAERRSHPDAMALLNEAREYSAIAGVSLAEAYDILVFSD